MQTPPLAVAHQLVASRTTDERRLELGQPPYAGVRCPGANSIACDRIGLAVWLVRRPSRLRATIAGRIVSMMPPDAGTGTAYWQGTLTSAGMLRPGPLPVIPDAGRFYWAGRHPRSFWVRLTATYPGRSPESIRVRVRLNSGWG